MAEQVLVRDSQQGYVPQLSLFDLPTQNSGVNKIQWVECKPTNDWSQDGAIDFCVYGNGTQYVDLKRTLLHIKAKIVKADGSPIPPVPANVASTPPEAKVRPVNLFLHSLWRQVDIQLQDTLISSAETTYAYKAIIDTLIHASEEAKNSQLQAEMFYEDKSFGLSAHNDPISGVNYGLNTRSKYFRESQEVDMQGPIMLKRMSIRKVSPQWNQVKHKAIPNE